MKKYLSKFNQKYILIDRKIDESDIDFWRNRLSRVILFVVFLVLSVVVVPSVFGAYYFKAWGVVVIDFVAYVFFTILLFSTKIGFQTRVSLMSMMFYATGIGILFILGPYGAGFLWMYCYPLLMALFKGKKWFFISLVANVFACLLYMANIQFKFFESSVFPSYDLLTFSLTASNFIAVNLLTAWPVLYLVTKLENALLQSERVSLAYKKQAEKLNEANLALDRYVYGLSHDIKGPISNVIGLAELYGATESHEEREEIFYLVKKSALKLENLLKTIVDFYQKQKLNKKIESINLKAHINRIIDNMSVAETYPNSNIVLNFDKNTSIQTDIYRITTILTNIISNALKYSQDVELPIVEINFTQNNDFNIISISDNGAGISEDQQTKIFDLFHQAAESKTGTGIGLYITKMAILDLEGEINVKSNPNSGVTFIVKLPRQRIANEIDKYNDFFIG